MTERRATFTSRLAALRKAEPLAVVGSDLELYLRGDPSGAARWRVSQSSAGRRLLHSAGLRAVGEPGPEFLRDPAWTDVTLGDTGGSTTFEWAGSGAEGHWRGHGDPFETRSITWGVAAGEGRAIRFAGCKSESLAQWGRPISRACACAPR
jgi:hypothetical protein